MVPAMSLFPAASPNWPFVFRRLALFCLSVLASAPIMSRCFGATAVSDHTQIGAHARLLVANKGDSTLSIVDPSTGQQIALVDEEGVTGHEVATSLDGHRAFVPIYGSGGVGGRGTDGRLMRVIDLEQDKIVGTVDFGSGVRPHCAVVGPKDGMIYVTTELLYAISVVDPRTLKVVATIPTGRPESHMLAITRDGRRGYTANVSTGTISVLDLVARKLVTVISVAPKAQRIALSADDRQVFTADQSQPRIAIVDTTTNQLSGWISLPAIGFSTAATPDGRWLLVTLSGVNELAVVDLHSLRVERTLDLPRSPQEVIVSPDGSAAYVSCDVTGQVAVIDPATWAVVNRIKAGAAADGLAWAQAR
jgi:DNA-binding beta-propeller fold protein YncE